MSLPDYATVLARLKDLTEEASRAHDTLVFAWATTKTRRKVAQHLQREIHAAEAVIAAARSTV